MLLLCFWRVFHLLLYIIQHSILVVLPVHYSIRSINYQQKRIQSPGIVLGVGGLEAKIDQRFRFHRIE